MKTLEDNSPRDADGANILVCAPYAGHERDPDVSGQAARAIIVEGDY